MKSKILVFCTGVMCGFLANAEELDRSVMSEAYWNIWNAEAQRKIDAAIEANRKADGAFAVDAAADTEVSVEQIDSAFRFGAPGVTDRDRMIQAVLTRNIYRAWFAHPKTMGITWWNTVDGAGVAGEPLVSGLFTSDMKKKPVYQVLDRLINHEWRTSLTVKAERKGDAGVVKFRGFRGRYRLSWTGADGKRVSALVDLN